MPNKNSSTAPTTKSGRARRASEKAKSMLEAATEKANSKQETAQRSAERAEKRSRKKAKTAEITRRRNQENEPPLGTQPVDLHQGTRISVADQDPSFTVQDIPVASKATIPRVNLIPQRGAVPRPPLAAASSSGNRSSASRTQGSTPKKLTPEKARYLLNLRDQMSNGNLRDIRKQISQSTTSSIRVPVRSNSTNTTRDEDENFERSARHTSPYIQDDDDDEPEGDFGYGTPNEDTDRAYNYNNIGDDMDPGLEDIEDDADLGLEDVEDDADLDLEGDDNERPDSPQAGQKRPRRDSDPAQPDISKYRKAIKVKNSKGKPKADDWEQEVQDVLAEAILSYETRLATLGFFPDHMQEVTWAKAAWLDGCRECGVKIHHNTELIKILTGRGTHLRGVIKTKARALVESTYGFEVSGDDAVEQNRKKVERLKDGFGFVYRKLGNGDQPNKGLYENSIIQRVVNQVWFAQRQLSPGIQFTEHFSPFPDPALAATLAAIENSIDEWGSGHKTDIHFTAVAYKPVYEEHLKMLDKFEEHTKEHGILPKILQRLHNNGRIFAKADPLGNQRSRDLPTSAFDAAIREFQNRDGNLSNPEDDD